MSTTSKVPPQAWFIISAIFHYLGPSFAVLLFPAVGVLGVAWFRIASAAAVFAPITRPRRLFARMDQRERRLLVGMGGGAAMALAFLAVFPVGIVQAARALTHPVLVMAGIGVGICSSVIPYVCDQLAMARLPRASFALMLTLLPASATIIGAVVLRQVPSPREVLGIALVMAAMALHRPYTSDA